MSSGHLLNRQWSIALVALLAAVLLIAFGRGAIPRQGQSTTFTITVVPLDAKSLACASDTVVGGRRCAFDGNQKPSGVDRPLRPFVTIGRELLLLSGVFESGSVASWVQATEHKGDESRVTLSCYAKILGTFTDVMVRWAPDGPFQPEQNVMTADVEDCVIKQQ